MRPGPHPRPYLVTGVDNMWINVGSSQFHLPSSQPQRLRGHIGLVVPDRESLLTRLSAVRGSLARSHFDVSEHEDYVEAVCPWGNHVRCYPPDAARFGPITLGMSYVAVDVPPESSVAIVDFYRDIFSAPASVTSIGGESTAVVAGGAEKKGRLY